jgi:predicted dehydrogenase
VATAEVGSIPWHGSGVRVEIYGTEGTIVGTAPQQMQFTGLHLLGARRGETQLTEIEVPAELRRVPSEVPSGTPFNLAQMMRSFTEGIHSGKTAGPTFADAVRNHRLLDAMERASSTGQVARVS